MYCVQWDFHEHMFQFQFLKLLILIWDCCTALHLLGAYIS